LKLYTWGLREGSLYIGYYIPLGGKLLGKPLKGYAARWRSWKFNNGNPLD